MPVTRKQMLEALATRRNPKVIFKQQDVSEEVIRHVPELWWELLAPVNVPMNKLYQVWEAAAGQCGSILRQMETHLQAVALLLEDNQPPSLIYAFRYEGGRLAFYRGLPPVDEQALSRQQAKFW